MSWRRNSLRRDLIRRFGDETGLPLFADKDRSPKEVRERLKRAPKAIQTADDTRKLGHLTATHDEISLGDKQQKVLDIMYLRDDWTNEEIAHKLEWGINRVVGRVYELRQLGLVVPCCKRQCTVTGMVVQAWRVK